MKVRSWFIIAIATLGLLVLTACGPSGLSADEAEELRNDLATVEERLDEVESQLSSLESGEADPEQVANEAGSAVQEARDTVSEVREAMEPPPEPEADPASVDPGAGNGLGDPAVP